MVNDAGLPQKEYKVAEIQPFTLGINLAWLDDQYDHDFGHNQVMDWVRGKTVNPAYSDRVMNHKKNMLDYLKNMRKMGVRIVRLWVFERFEGLEFDKYGYVKDVDRDLIDNFVLVCKEAIKLDLKFYFCLMDTWGIWNDKNISRMDKETKLIPIINGLITDPNKTMSFINKAVMPFISNTTIKDRIWAVDVLNEPEGLERKNVLRAKSWEDSGQMPAVDTGIIYEQLMEFVKICAVSIHANVNNMKVSCGFQNYETLKNTKYFLNNKGKRSKLEIKKYLENCLDFYDFHMYSDNADDLPSYSSLGLIRPCRIGECGQKTEIWDNIKQKNTVRSFLCNAKSKGYAGCFIWNYGYKGLNKTNKNNCHSLINPDGTSRPAFNEIKKFPRNCPGNILS